MANAKVSISSSFSSPAWGSNLVVFATETGNPIPEKETKDYLVKACDYAKKHKVYLVPNAFIMLGIEGMCLIDPTGKVVGAQQKLFFPQPNKWQKDEPPPVESSNKISLLNTDIGRVFLAVGEDIYRPELMRIAYNRGGEIVVNAHHITTKSYGNHRIIAGAWNAAQSNRLYVVSVTNYLNCIAAPRAVTRHNDGFILSPTNRLPSVGQLDLYSLKELPPRDKLTPKFYDIHREELTK